MLIISEENKKLKGTKYRLPKDIKNIFFNIVKKGPQHCSDTVYKKAKNVVKDGGIITMEWLKNMKSFFKAHKDESDPEFCQIGGYNVKTYVESKLDKLTDSYGRVEHFNSATKPRKPASNLGGNRGEHSSESLSIVKSLLADAIPRMESKENRKKTLIITEEQLRIYKNIYNKNNN